MVEHRTTHHDPVRVRRELDLPASLVRVGRARALAGDRLVLRTPHDVSLAADGTTTPLTHQTALTVAELLAAQRSPSARTTRSTRRSTPTWPRASAVHVSRLTRTR